MSSESVKNRHNQREQVRQVQQEQAQRKRELAAQQREDLRTIKEFYTNEQKQIDAEGAAAVSHLSEEAAGISGENRTYGRNAKLQRPEVMQQDYETKKSDLFYKVQDRGSQLSEGSDGYTIEAYSPEYEKDQIHVTVQNNKAVVSGHRKFQDQAMEDNKKISTNNYQSFREEFQFDSPVASDAMTQERSGDFISVYIPKLSSIDFSENE
jgi:HSP20 family molecular chaperone IbpA